MNLNYAYAIDLLSTFKKKLLQEAELTPSETASLVLEAGRVGAALTILQSIVEDHKK
jgi:hypothetical protein